MATALFLLAAHRHLLTTAIPQSPFSNLPTLLPHLQSAAAYLRQRPPWQLDPGLVADALLAADDINRLVAQPGDRRGEVGRGGVTPSLSDASLPIVPLPGDLPITADSGSLLHVVQTAYNQRAEDQVGVLAALRLAAALIEDPHPGQRGSLVPGQYPAQIDSAAPALDPLVGSTLLALALEGLVGLGPHLGQLAADPHLPPEWTWFAATDIPYQGQKVSIAYLNGVLYSAWPVTTDAPLEVFDRADVIPGDVCAIVFQRPGERRLFAASTTPTATFLRFAGRSIPVQLEAGEAIILTI
jgi:hypothetical protein